MVKDFLKRYNLWIILAVLIGIYLRFYISQYGWNFDFESYKIVGKIVANGGNVYQETVRYNYAPLFSIIQGLFYKTAFVIAFVFKTHPEIIYRNLFITLLTLTDLGLSYYVYKKSASIILAGLFFLNPVSIMITGYHNQFDNIAVLLGLSGIEFMLFATAKNQDNLNKYDVLGIAFLSLSLITKHILFFFPIWILFNQNINIKRKICYALIPPLLFLLSFYPYINGGLIGIVNNVFLYRSFPNMPIFFGIQKIFPLITLLFFPLFCILMTVSGLVLRKCESDKLILWYFICLVGFSSAIANQYLVVPLVSLFLLTKYAKYLYVIIVTVFFLTDKNELYLLPIVYSFSPHWLCLLGLQIMHFYGRSLAVLTLAVSFIKNCLADKTR